MKAQIRYYCPHCDHALMPDMLNGECYACNQWIDPPTLSLPKEGEEVSDDLRKQFADENKIIISDCSLITENHSEEYIEWLEAKLTRPTVSEEEIDRMFPLEESKFMFKPSEEYNRAQFYRREGAKAIKELLNR